MNDLTDEQRARNWYLLWDIRRNIRYAAKRAGWFDTVHRWSCWFTSIAATATFGSFAGDWPRVGMAFSIGIALLASLCAHFDYPKKAALFRDLRKDYKALLAEAMEANGLKMTEDDWRRLCKAYCLIEAKREEALPATLTLLMNACENEVAEYDMEEPSRPICHIPSWSIFIRQLWPWRWPSCSQEEYDKRKAKKKPAK